MHPSFATRQEASVNGSMLDGPRARPARPLAPDPLDDITLVEKGMRLLRNRWWVILQAAIVVPVAALALSLAQHKSWTATTTLLFRPSSQNAGSIDITREAATQAAVIGLPVVAQRAAQTLGHGWTPLAVRNAIAISSSPDNDLVSVSGTASSPRAAARLADGYAQAFIALQDASNLADVQRGLRVYDAYINSLPPDQRDSERGLRLQQRLDNLKINQALQTDSREPSARVMQPAQVPSSPSSPRTKRNVALGIVLGLVIGFALAAALERLDRRIKTVDELEQIAGLPVLARIPRVRSLGKRLGNRGGASDVLRQGAEAAAFRSLRASLSYFNVDGDLRSLLVVSPDAQDGKSTVAACLATTLAQRGDRVALVETDLHKPAREDARGAGTLPALAVGAGPEQHRTGLSTVLAGGSLEDALISVSADAGDGRIRPLVVLPSGPVPPNPSELLESQRMREVMKMLSERFDFVLYDSPATTAVSDALPLVPETTGVIVVSRLHHTSRDRMRDLLKQLGLLRAHVLGVVANCSDPQKRRGYDYYYGGV
jgi:capsular exopolysaccharide synthesis family protein